MRWNRVRSPKSTESGYSMPANPSTAPLRTICVSRSGKNAISRISAKANKGITSALVPVFYGDHIRSADSREHKDSRTGMRARGVEKPACGHNLPLVTYGLSHSIGRLGLTLAARLRPIRHPLAPDTVRRILSNQIWHHLLPLILRRTTVPADSLSSFPILTFPASSPLVTLSK
jgi:hypothetical protein